MRVHHLNCISQRALGGVLMDGKPKVALRAELTCHCLLVETGEELVLVDTGFGLRDCADPQSRISKEFLAMNQPDFREELTAIRQIERLGYAASDVRHILLTHLDFDHAGGLDDFPEATVHLLADEVAHATSQRTRLDRQRFRPQQWSTRSHWRTYAAGEGDSWYGFECVRDIPGLPPEILIVPLAGHTRGHAGIAVRRSNDWLFHAGDAYFYHRELDPERHRCTPGLRFYQWMMETDREQRLQNQRRLRALASLHPLEVTVFCAHDPVEFERLSGVPVRESLEPLPGMPPFRAERPAAERRIIH